MTAATAKPETAASASAQEPPPPDSDAVEPPASSIGRNASSMFAANLVYAACQWATLSLVARLGDTSLVGRYVAAAAITAPVMAFCMLNLRALQASDARREFPFTTYLGLRVVSLALSLLVITAVAIAANHTWETGAVLAAVSLVAAVEALSDVFYGAIQQREQLVRVAQSVMLKSVAGLALFSALLVGSGSLTWALLAVAAVRLAVLLAWDAPQTRRLLAAPDNRRANQEDAGKPGVPEATANALLSTAGLLPASWAPLAWQALPMGVVMMLISLSTTAPRYFVEFHLGEDALGLFGAVAYFMLVGKLAIGAVGQTYTPTWSVAAAEGRRGEFFATFWRLVLFGAGLGIAGVAVAALAGRPILWLAYGPEYAARQDLLVWMMLACVMAYPASIAGFALTAARCFRIQVVLYGLTALATFGACAVLVPQFGLAGAAASLLLAALIQVVAAVVVLNVALPRPATPQFEAGGAE